MTSVRQACHILVNINVYQFQVAILKLKWHKVTQVSNSKLPACDRKLIAIVLWQPLLYEVSSEWIGPAILTISETICVILM